METQIEAQLSFELQELYLENKEWLSTISFIEDEVRFFQQLFKRVVESPIKQNDFEKVELVKLNLFDFQKRRIQLKTTITNRNLLLQSMLKNEITSIPLAFIEEDAAIVNEIKALLAKDKNIKKQLFSLVETIKPENKIQKYPIL